MDHSLNIVSMVLGGVAGFSGGAVSALTKQGGARETALAVLGGTGLGTFVAPFFVAWFDLPLPVSGVIGFVGGLGVFGIVTGIQTLANRFAERPESLLPESVRGRIHQITLPDQPLVDQQTLVRPQAPPERKDP